MSRAKQGELIPLGPGEKIEISEEAFRNVVVPWVYKVKMRFRREEAERAIKGGDAETG